MNKNYYVINVFWKEVRETDKTRKYYLNLHLHDRDNRKKPISTELIEIKEDPEKDEKKLLLDTYTMIDNVLDFCEKNDLEYHGLLNNQGFYSFLAVEKRKKIIVIDDSVDDSVDY